MTKRLKYVAGIDEVGRGPLAGPVTIGICVVEEKYHRRLSRQKDSKQLTPRVREYLAKQLLADPSFRFAVASVTAKTIDRIGINPAIRLAIKRAIVKLDLDPNSTMVYLDGGLQAPSEFMQQTVIRGDATIPVIAYASIVAKVHRDHHMQRIAQAYPKYHFEKHVGYGTKMHIASIKQHGPSPLHRRTFLRNILLK